MAQSNIDKGCDEDGRYVMLQRVDVWCESISFHSAGPSLLSRRPDGVMQVGVSRNCCVIAKDLIESGERRFLAQFEWYRGLEFIPSQRKL